MIIFKNLLMWLIAFIGIRLLNQIVIPQKKPKQFVYDALKK